jgi:hypothetical protein
MRPVLMVIFNEGRMGEEGDRPIFLFIVGV